jgi:hypothetical protein
VYISVATLHHIVYISVATLYHIVYISVATLHRIVCISVATLHHIVCTYISVATLHHIVCVYIYQFPHSIILCIYIIQATIKDGIPSEKMSKVHLVDLAGRYISSLFLAALCRACLLLTIYFTMILSICFTSLSF